tara:strand:- start:354 stop:746 length:393 start_codon:yes stop_codon:yes gene_type:complete
MIKETIERWESCGVKSIDTLSLRNHYSVMFDDEVDGFQHLFNSPIEDIKTLQNHQYLEQKIIELDEIMLLVSSYMENFIKQHFLRDIDGDITIGELMDDYLEQIKGHYNDAMLVKHQINEYLDGIVVNDK